MIIFIIMLSVFNATFQEGKTKVKYTVLNLFIIYGYHMLRIAGFDNFASHPLYPKMVDKYWNTYTYSTLLLMINTLVIP